MCLSHFLRRTWVVIVFQKTVYRNIKEGHKKSFLAEISDKPRVGGWRSPCVLKKKLTIISTVLSSEDNINPLMKLVYISRMIPIEKENF